jgi:uncharacterized membrane protein SpoIIM required for sporulation
MEPESIMANIKTIALVILVGFIFAFIGLSMITITEDNKTARYEAKIARSAYENEKMSHASTTVTAFKYAEMYQIATEQTKRLWLAAIGEGKDIGCLYCHSKAIGG